MELLLFVFGIGLLAGAGVTAASWQVLRRAFPDARIGWAAVLAGVAAAATWVLFSFDWLDYSLDETRPSYYPHSDYVEYRSALDGGAGLAIGLGYALLTGSLVALSEATRRRKGPGWASVPVLLALGAVALPLLVPAALPRAEYGKDPVFHVSDAGQVEYQPFFPKVCFFYGVERSPEPVGGPEDPELCLEFRPTPAGRALVRESLPTGDQPTILRRPERVERVRGPSSGSSRSGRHRHRRPRARAGAVDGDVDTADTDPGRPAEPGRGSRRGEGKGDRAKRPSPRPRHEGKDPPGRQAPAQLQGPYGRLQTVRRRAWSTPPRCSRRYRAGEGAGRSARPAQLRDRELLCARGGIQPRRRAKGFRSPRLPAPRLGRMSRQRNVVTT
jgi:hypothetical protein